MKVYCLFAANRGLSDETVMVNEEKGMSLVVALLLRSRYFEFLLFPLLFWSNISQFLKIEV